MNTGHQYLQQLILCKAPKLSRIVPRSKLFRGVPKMTRLYKFCKFCKLLLRNTNKVRTEVHWFSATIAWN